MKPTELLSFLASAIVARLPILITGAPGIGKTDIIKRAAASVDYDVIVSFPSVEDPTEPGGYPWIAEDRSHATKVLFGAAYRAVTATRPTVWFLDDLGQATAATQAGYMQWLLAGEMNGHKLPPHVTMIAATNRRTDRAGVSGVLEPVKSRFASIVELVPDTNDWCAWALDCGFVPPEMIAYLRLSPDSLCRFSASADLVNSPVPRTWSHVARLMALGLPAPLQHQAIVGAIGEGEATAFAGFLRLYAELPSVDQILIDPSSVPVPSSPSTLYALSSALAHRATEKNFGRVGQYIDRMVQAGYAEFGVLIARDALRRNPLIAQTAGFVRLATGDLGSLIS